MTDARKSPGTSASEPRVAGSWSWTIIWRPLVRKPGALPGATALEQARAAGKFTPVHDAWWAAASKAHGDREGTRALIDVLLLNRQMNHEHVVAGIAAALR